jgi:hypothetical protein
MKNILIFLKFSIFTMPFFLISCAAKADNEMKDIAHDVINKNRGVMIRFEPIEAQPK